MRGLDPSKSSRNTSYSGGKSVTQVVSTPLYPARHPVQTLVLSVTAVLGHVEPKRPASWAGPALVYLCNFHAVISRRIEGLGSTELYSLSST